MKAFVFSAAGMFVLDQATKWAVVFQMDLANVGRIEVWPGLLTFQMGWNTGVNFGLFGTDSAIARWALVALGLVISLALTVYAYRSLAAVWPTVLAGAIVGGALGNVLDRILYGAVADFLNVTCCGIHNPFAFNVADIGVVVGALGLVFFTPEPDKKA